LRSSDPRCLTLTFSNRRDRLAAVPVAGRASERESEREKEKEKRRDRMNERRRRRRRKRRKERREGIVECIVLGEKVCCGGVIRDLAQPKRDG
jgi:Ni/Co efflux regulator RcnB